MTHKSRRKGLTLRAITDMFQDEDTAKAWLAECRWPDGKAKCPYCGTSDVQTNIKHRTMMCRCRQCEGKPMFSLKTGTVMERSNLKYRVWAVGIYLFTTNLQGVSSIQLHRELGIGQKAGWFMLRRLRAAFEAETGRLPGPVDVETHMGGKRKNMPNSVRKELKGRGPESKTAVVGAKDRETNQLAAKAVESTERLPLQGAVNDYADLQVTVSTDEAGIYETAV